jgi:hypothetical protein
LGDINLLPSRQGYRIFFGFDPRLVGRGVHIVRARVTYAPDGGQNESRHLKLKAIIGSPEDHETLQPVKPFEPQEKKELMDDWQRGPMLRNKPVQPTLDFGRLPFYDVPNDYWHQAQAHADNDSFAKIHLESRLPHVFEARTYKQHWQNLLWHEEIAMWFVIIQHYIFAYL